MTAEELREVTARGLPAELWRPVLDRARALDPQSAPAVVLVVAPHPDDETLGAGGLIHRFAAAGSDVCVVFVTDGAAGYPDAGAAQVEELVRIRRQEARVALEILGVPADRTLFLDQPDGGIAGPRESELADRLAPLLTAMRADLCLAPWPLDPHPDHQAVGRAAVTAGRTVGVTLWQYPIWMRHSIEPNDSRVDADRLRVLRLAPSGQSAKQAAIKAHASQLRSPFPGYGPVLPEHVLDLFADGREPFFVADPDAGAV